MIWPGRLERTEHLAGGLDNQRLSPLYGTEKLRLLRWPSTPKIRVGVVDP